MPNLPWTPEWVVRFVAHCGGGWCPNPLIICPQLEWHSRADAMHGQPIWTSSDAPVDEDPRGWWLTLHYANAPVNVIMWWRGWNFDHRGQQPLFKEFHLSGLCLGVGQADPPNGLRWAPIYDTRNVTISRFYRLTAAIARVIEDGYDYDALCASLRGATNVP